MAVRTDGSWSRHVRTDAGLGRGASRSTTTCVIGTAKRSRAAPTTLRSSQCERPSGCVEMTISSAPKVRSASSIAWSGSPSPTSPCRRGCRRARAARGWHRAGLCAAARAPSSSDAQVRTCELSAGQTTSTFACTPSALLPENRQQLLAADRLVRDHEDPALVLAPAPRHLGPLHRLVRARAHPEPDGRRGEHDEDDDAEPRRDRSRRDDQREVPHRQQQEAVGLGFAAERVSRHRHLRGGRSSRTPRSTLRRRSASRFRAARRRDDARA